ncbi:unnamed protein product [Trichobilharzia regenti]|nr:unnamed protein product [Trichobilharzia regenti]
MCRSHDNNTSESLIAKPSELLRRVRALMNALLDLENHVCIDVIGIFSTVFTQHTQPVDAFRDLSSILNIQNYSPDKDLFSEPE